MSKRVIGFLSVVDPIPDGAEFLYNKPLIIDETKEERTKRIITGEIKLQSIEQVFYEVDEADFRQIKDRLRLTATQRITNFLKQQ